MKILFGKIKFIPIFAKLVAGFLVVFLLLYALAYQTMVMLTNGLEKEFRNNQIMQINAEITGFENQLEAIREQIRRISNDAELESFLLSSKPVADYNSVAYINALMAKIYNLQDTNELILNVKMHLVPLNRTIQSSGDSFKKSDKKDYEYLLKDIPDNSLSDIHLIYRNGVRFVSSKYLFINGKRELMYMLDVQFSDAKIKSHLNKIVSTVDGEILVFHINGNFQYYVGKGEYDNEVEHEIKRLYAEKKFENDGAVAAEYKDNVMFIDKLKGFESYIGVFYNKSLLKNILKNYNSRLVLFSIISILFSVYVCLLLYRLISASLKKLIKAFQNVENGDLSVRISPTRNDEFSYIFLYFNSMVEKLKALIEKDYQQRILSQKAEIKQLQYQINPHFLYNSLFQIKLMASQEDYENIERFTNHLSEYYRYITKANINQIFLQSEVEHAKNYLEIQSFRFKGRYDISIDELPEQVSKFFVPRLIMQPILENAFQHGLKEAENGLLRISMQYNAPNFYTIFEDSGHFIPAQNLDMLQKYIDGEENNNYIETCTGIFNVNKRLKLFFGEGSGITVSTSELGGLKVTMKIEFKENNIEQ